MSVVRKQALFALLLALVLASTSGCEAVHLAADLDRLQEAVATESADSLSLPTPLAVTPVPALPTPAPAEAQEDLAALYERVIPSVVSIRVIRKEATLLPQTTQQGEEQFTQGQGSGFVVDAEERLVVTNNHVAEDAELIEVVLQDGSILRAELLGSDPDSDVAVLRVEEDDDVPLVEVALGDSAAVKVGQRAIAIGNPFGWQGTMTVGIISGLGRTLSLGHSSEQVGGGRFSIPQMIQTDAAINYGNSGGPLLDGQGRVIGINTAMNSLTGVSGGVGFAVPINTVRRVLPDLIAKGHYEYSWLGIAGTDLQPVHVEAMDLAVDRGALVTDVVEGGPAGKGGLRGADREVDYYGAKVRVGGDVIVAVDGQPVRQFDDLLIYLVDNTSPGDRITLTYVREGEEHTAEVTLGSRPVR